MKKFTKSGFIIACMMYAKFWLKFSKPQLMHENIRISELLKFKKKITKGGLGQLVTNLMKAIASSLSISYKISQSNLIVGWLALHKFTN
jgi:hypothetical protein